MKKLFFFVAIVITFASCTQILPTEVGFKIDNSGDYRGIDSLPLLTGFQWYFPGLSSIVTIPTTQQHIVWTLDSTEGATGNEELSVSCLGGAGFKMDVGLNYRVNAFKASKIYLKYSTSDLDKISSTYLRNAVRGAMQDVSGHITVDSLLNNLPGFEDAVRNLLSQRLEKEGFIVDLFNVLDQPRPSSKNLAEAISNKITAKQNAETSIQNLQTAIADANQKIAVARGDSASGVIEAAGRAEGIKKLQAELTPTYVDYVKWSRADSSVPRVPSTVLGSNVLYQQK